MKMRTLRNLCMLTACILFGVSAQAQLSGSYTIDPSGSGASNYTSIGAAVSALQSDGVSGAVTFTIAQGTYNERVELPPISGASSTNTITFDGVSVDSVTISYTSSSFSDRAAVHFDAGDYYVLKNVRIEANGGSYRCGLHFSDEADYNVADSIEIDLGSNSSTNYRAILFASDTWSSGDEGNYNEISNVEITNAYWAIYLRGSNTSTYNSYNVFTDITTSAVRDDGIYDFYGRYNTYRRVTHSPSSFGYGYYGYYNYYNVVDSCDFDDAYYAIYQNRGDHNSFTNNVFSDHGFYGVYFSYSDDNILDNNEISGSSSGYYNIRVNRGTDNIITNNLIENARYGYYGYYADRDSLGGNIFKDHEWYQAYPYRSNNGFINNNIFDGRGLRTNSTAAYNIRLYFYCAGWTIWHNTIYSSGGSTGSRSYAYSVTANIQMYFRSSAEIWNNIIEYDGSATNGTNIASYYSTLDADYNNYISSGLLLVTDFGAPNYDNLSDWQAADQSNNQNSTDQSITFANKAGGDFHLSPLVPGIAGADLGLTVDVDGDSRCEFSQTIGADESPYPVRKPTAGFAIDDTVFVNSEILALNSNGNKKAHNHTWYVDGTRVSNNDQLKYTFTNRGTADIKLVTENCGGADSITKTVVVDTSTLAPTADFAVSASTIDVFDEIEITDLSTNGPTRWRWYITPDSILDPLFNFTVPRFTWTDGTNQNSRNPSFTLDYPGTYSIGVAISNGAGQDSIMKQDIVVVRATQNMCIFPDQTDVPSGTLFDEGGPTGEYGNNNNCTYLIDPCADEVYLEFRSLSIAAGDYLRVYDGADADGTPLWDVNAYGTDGITGNMANSNFDTMMTAESGLMYIEFESNGFTTDAGFEAKWTSKRGTFITPDAQFDGPDSVCVGHTATFENQSTGDIRDYTWNFGVNAFSIGSGEVGSYTYTQAGTYDVTLTTSGCGGTDSISKTIVAYNIAKTPVGDFEADITRPTVDDIVTFTPETENCVDKIYWTVRPSANVNFVQGTNDSSMVPRMQFLGSGTYSVTMRMVNVATFDTVQKVDYIEVIDYCTPSVALQSEDLGISRVQLNGQPNLDFTSSSGRFAYSDFTGNTSTRVEKGADYRVTVSRPSNNNSIRRAVWIDWDQDGDFEKSELLGQEATGGTSNLDYVINFTAPTNAREGGTRMRVASNVGSRANSACGPNLYGEYEDYRIFVTKDQTIPEITLNGSEVVEVDQCDTYTDAGVTVCDNIGGCGYSYTTTGLPITVNVPDTYTVTYNAVDSAGNEAMPVERTVIVVADDVPPTITMNGADTIYVEVFDPYTELGVSATDFCGSATVDTISTVDTTVVGTYTVNYIAVDGNNNTSSINRTVIVQDTESPVLTLKHTDTVQVEVLTSYTDSGVVATDNYYSQSSGISITSADNIDMSTLGTYEFTYSATDASGNMATSVTRIVEVVDRTAPSVELLGDDTVYVEVNTRIYDMLASATDNYDGALTTPVKGGDYYTSFPNGVASDIGTFTAEYSFTDASGNTASVSRTVIVEDTEAPTISLVGGKAIKIARWEDFQDPGYVVDDNYDTAPAVVVDDQEFTTTSEGLYYITYYAEDQSGNKSEIVTRIVEVVQVASSISENNLNDAIQVYPNPNNGVFNLNIDLGSSQVADITIVNMLGKTVQTVHSGMIMKDNFNVRIAEDASGVYFVRVQTDNETIVKRVTVSK